MRYPSVSYINWLSFTAVAGASSLTPNYNDNVSSACDWYTASWLWNTRSATTSNNQTAQATTTSTSSSGDFAAAQVCNAASLSWLLNHGSWSRTEIPSTVVETSVYTYVTPANATPYTTLCDGIPRAHGTASYFLTSSANVQFAITSSALVTPVAQAAKPQCIIDNVACSCLYSSANSSFQSVRSVDMTAACRLCAGNVYTQPACSSPSPPSGSSSSFQYESSLAVTGNATSTTSVQTNCTPPPGIGVYGIDGGSSVSCVVTGGPVKLAYWPVTVKGDLCGNRTTVPFNISTTRTASVFGTTVLSPEVIVSFETLYAVDGCGHTIGSALSNYLMTQQATQISSQCGAYHAGLGYGKHTAERSAERYLIL